MDKKEKYYNLIVNDLIKKTEIDYEDDWNEDGSDQEILIYPFFRHPIPTNEHPPTILPPKLEYRFSKHVIEKYGTHDDEVGMIWGNYRKRLQTLIKK
tara:strand:+ start:898 stop:1188 length:291 start_codon:yes stop_codon:yes gene_type:complete